MKIKNFRTRMIAPVLLLIPMACMHMGDDHHSDHGHFSALHPSHQYSILRLAQGDMVEVEGRVIPQEVKDRR